MPPKPMGLMKDPVKEGVQRNLGGWGVADTTLSSAPFQTFPLGSLRPHQALAAVDSSQFSCVRQKLEASGACAGVLLYSARWASRVCYLGPYLWLCLGKQARMCQLDCHYGRVNSKGICSRAVRHGLSGVLRRA